MYEQETLFGQYDASLGLILLGDGNIHWKTWEPSKSGFVVDGDARRIVSLKTKGGILKVIGIHDGAIEVYRYNKQLLP